MCGGVCWGIKSYFVGEHKERESWCMSISVSGLNPEVELTPIRGADIAL